MLVHIPCCGYSTPESWQWYICGHSLLMLRSDIMYGQIIWLASIHIIMQLVWFLSGVCGCYHKLCYFLSKTSRIKPFKQCHIAVLFQYVLLLYFNLPLCMTTLYHYTQLMNIHAIMMHCYTFLCKNYCFTQVIEAHACQAQEVHGQLTS